MNVIVIFINIVVVIIIILLLLLLLFGRRGIRVGWYEAGERDIDGNGDVKFFQMGRGVEMRGYNTLY